MSRFLGAAQPVLNSDGTPGTIAVASTGVVYTRSFALNGAEYFGLWLIATSVLGTADIKVELEQSYKLPTTEGAADALLWAVPDGMSDVVSSTTTELPHQYSVGPIPMTYARYKLTGVGSNPADTIVEMYNFLQE